MLEDSYKTIRKLLASTNFEELREGLELVRSEISRIGAQEAKPLFEVVSTIFYIDPWDHPELVPILDEAISLVVGFGDFVIPCLMKNLDSGDITPDAQTILDEAQKEQDIIDNLPSWSQVEANINNISDMDSAKAFILKLARVVYWDVKNRPD